MKVAESLIAFADLRPEVLGNHDGSDGLILSDLHRGLAVGTACIPLPLSAIIPFMTTPLTLQLNHSQYVVSSRFSRFQLRHKDQQSMNKDA